MNTKKLDRLERAANRAKRDYGPNDPRYVRARKRYLLAQGREWKRQRVKVRVIGGER
jgi:hypothetical protein